MATYSSVTYPITIATSGYKLATYIPPTGVRSNAIVYSAVIYPATILTSGYKAVRYISNNGLLSDIPVYRAIKYMVGFKRKGS